MEPARGGSCRERAEHVFGRFAPEIVQDRVERTCGVQFGDTVSEIVVAEPDHGLRPGRPQPLQPLGVAAHRDHRFRAEHRSGQLHGCRSGHAGAAEHQDVVTGLDRRGVRQRDPRRRARVGQGGRGHGVDAFGDLDGPPGIDQGALGHQPVRSDAHGVHPPAVRQPRHAVEPGDDGKLDLLGGVVFSRGDPLGEVGERAGLDLGDLGAFARLRVGQVGVHGRLAPGSHDGGFHGIPPWFLRIWFLWKR
uniref:Uncharacterized protein n=1 Tax=Mycolicibacterium smegmatis TaxID=1772 RepID=Q7WTY4_MYCSM|nr:unknown [Mycolicibacterium smegmatis]